MMRNPWTKKNPFLSMWLSGANAVIGAARGHVTAEANRQSEALMRATGQQIQDFWLGGMASKTRRRKKRAIKR